MTQTISKTILIQNLKGLHARATAAFVKTASLFQSDIEIYKGNASDLTVSGKSIMGIFSLDLTKNLILEINGDEEQFIKDIGNMGIYIEPISIGV